MLKVAVVILNWNGKELLEKFLPSVLSYSGIPSVSVYIADNCSDDNSVDYIRYNHPEAHIIILDRNYGFAGGYNRALKQIEAQYYVLLNSDVEVTEGWLDPMIELLDNNSDIAACMPKILSYQDREIFEYAGAAGGFIDKYGFTFCRGRIFNVFEKDENQYNNDAHIFWATGACLFIRADMFHTSGGLDDRFFAHMEEIDLCWRLKNRGKSIVYCAGSKVYHLGGGTLNKTNPRKTYLNFRNNLFLLYKNAQPKTAFRIIITRLFLDMIAGLKFLVGLEFKNFISV
ncbi:MAG: glycosyltransferase family 2 protein, partial [Bacteroidota bacterium]